MQLDCGLQALGGHMGTYTTNYNLFMPTVGEQGWGDLVNGNFSTIDTTMKSLSNRITAVENEVNGNLSCTSVATSGTITSTGKITSSNVIQCQKVYVDGRILTTKMSDYSPTYATCAAQSTSCNLVGNGSPSTSTLTANGYSKSSISYPARVGAGIYVPAEANIKSGSVPTSVTHTLTFSLSVSGNSVASAALYVNGTKVTTLSTSMSNRNPSTTYSVKSGDKVYAQQTSGSSSALIGTISISIPAAPTYYLDGI